MSNARKSCAKSCADRTGAGSKFSPSDVATLVQAGAAIVQAGVIGQGIGSAWSWANKDGRVVDAVRRAVARRGGGPGPGTTPPGPAA